MKASGAWRPVVDLSTLNLWIQQTSFRMETLQSVLLSVRPGDWWVSLDLKDAYLQVSCTRFPASSSGSWWWGRCTCSRYFASAFPRLRKFLPGSWLLCQLFYAGWGYDFVATWTTGCFRLPHASRSPCSEDSAPTLQTLRDCHQLGGVSGVSDSTDGLSGSHPGLCCFQGFSCPEGSREAFLTWRRILVLRQSASVILAVVLGMLSSMIQLVPGGHLRMGSLQLTLRRQWDQIDQSQLVEWSPGIQDVLSWWLDRDRFVLGVSLEQVSPQLELWSDALDVCWGAHLAELVASGLWLRKTSSARSMHGSSWRSRELSSGLLHFLPVPQWRSSPTIRQPCRICGTKAGLVLLF